MAIVCCAVLFATFVAACGVCMSSAEALIEVLVVGAERTVAVARAEGVLAGKGV